MHEVKGDPMLERAVQWKGLGVSLNLPLNLSAIYTVQNWTSLSISVVKKSI